MTCHPSISGRWVVCLLVQDVNVGTTPRGKALLRFRFSSRLSPIPNIRAKKNSDIVCIPSDQALALNQTRQLPGIASRSMITHARLSPLPYNLLSARNAQEDRVDDPQGRTLTGSAPVISSRWQRLQRGSTTHRSIEQLSGAEFGTCWIDLRLIINLFTECTAIFRITVCRN